MRPPISSASNRWKAGEADRLAACIRDQDTTSLVKVPGIGKKTAERMVLELREKAGAVGSATSLGAGHSAAPATPLAEARSALESLGYRPVDATKMTEAFTTEGLGTDQIIREALKRAVR